MKATELKEKALALPQEERLELGQVLMGSSLPPLTKAQQAHLNRAVVAFEANPDDIYSEKQVNQEVLDRLKR
jgi:hypothetical protein